MIDWQPIEYAPKDGRTLLVCQTGERPVGSLAWWDTDYEVWITENGWPLHFNPTHFSTINPPEEKRE